jgi:hypothetical protein
MTKEGVVLEGGTVAFDGRGLSDSVEHGEAVASAMLKQAADHPRSMDALVGQVDVKEETD